ncbi:MAG: histone deacetylase [Pseudanabaena sp. M135S2SP2A07QC]|jgi:acetoin utilization deacetylase AcuC-like enzyme|nr:histone deacetylase [Pseudanabaena sp. M090S1SP2A07QC]MCA6508389.1 histone deacetylase [Pseudanabaena sp. M172S2SP2A07QC]MCA6518809.1 histone deacetylase [Pseudanabaena sp. M110S1SP2A07QC]MCA6522391.1 histone deacetylase [Pseudanabaena sp. M051S1SP2A07QC]MCA6526801.1 histone deacetylase [Pseudanabaena sp. M179S2SP2A07QC]MCA6532593.1 histone deacetylase [Pseudanabaena sp. M125S2SP2A07QC]MCA6536467.1 histone deacetylase [Pseudanabaena sp. M176S2SP2A07QC]MCA6540146.1 histone deacetylase [Pse
MDLPLIYHPNYVAPIANTNRFPMEKFRLLYEMLLADGVARPEQFFRPELPELDAIALVHDRKYVDAYWTGNLDPKAQRRIGLPWSPELADRTRIAVGGTLLTARLALAHGLACNTAGGTHHAFPSYGSGFCIFNDLAIASRVLLKEGLIKKILIVDLDVHQGDGTALIFQDEPNVFTFSMHCQINFPSIKQISDRDVPLREGMEDDEYLRTLANYLPDLLTEFQPDLVLYDAGVDPHIGDRLGKLALTDAGIFRRDMQVLSTCAAQRVPVACVIGGGYCEDMRSLVYRHSLLHRAASEIYRQYRL